MLLSLTTLAQRVTSFSTKRPNSSGADKSIIDALFGQALLHRGVIERLGHRRIHPGDDLRAASSPARAGPTTPRHRSPATPSSLTVGVSGNCAMRLAEVPPAAAARRI